MRDMSEAEFDAALAQYGDTVYRLAFAYTRNRADADDVFQEVFLRYFRRAPAFETEEHRKAWLLRVTINRAKSCLSRRRPRAPCRFPRRRRWSCTRRFRSSRRNTAP